MSHIVPEKSVLRFERIGTHSHIKGLGLKDGKPLMVADGFVGQMQAREAAGIVVEMIKSGRMAGRAILLVGPPGTGKTALAIAIARELGEETPFMILSGSEIYSAEMKKTEVLMQAMRKSIGVRIREFRKVYEGQVVDLKIDYNKHPYNPYQQVPVGAKITLKTKDEEKTFSVDETITSQLIGRGVSVGDVIWIDAETGRVTKVGVSSEKGTKYDIGVSKKIPVPSGPIAKEKEFVYTVTLHDLDTMQAISSGLVSLIFGAREEKEISPEIRQRVDETVKKWVDEGTAQIIPGVMFIDDVHMLDIEALSFLSRAMEGELSPIIILASNRGFTKIRGTDIVSPHGLPLDLLDRLLIIKTKPYNRDEIREILKIRAKEEKVNLSEEGLETLTDIGVKYSLRYAVQLLTPASIIARSKGKDKISPEDINHVKELFVDLKRSADYLKKYEEAFLR